MEILFISASFCLLSFMVLATYDGFYPHIFKDGLFHHEERVFAHKTRTIRAVLFPLISWALFINEAHFSLLLIGLGLVFLDLVILAVDAYSEKENRNFMDGLPRWRYIIHLFSNAFHFSALVLVLAPKMKITTTGLLFVTEFAHSRAKELFTFVSVNVIPGAILLAMVHLVLMLKIPRTILNTYRTKITCC